MKCIYEIATTQQKALGLAMTFFFLVGCAASKTKLKLGKTAEGEVVEAEGFAPNNPQDVIQTKRASLIDAQRTAVEKAVGVFVSGKTMVEKAVAIENNILARTDGYVKKYDVISEGPSENNLYRTRIRALVAVKDLEKDLKDMSLLKGPELQRPRVSIVLDEQYDRITSKDAAALGAMQRSLADQGFVVLSGKRAQEAELIIKGKASSFPFQDSGLGGFISYRARVSVQARRAGSEDVLVSVAKEASGLGGNADLAAMKSLETVGELAGKDIGEQIAQAWSRGKNVLVFIEGAKSFSQVERIRKHLISQPGVKDITLRSYDDDMAQFEVQLDRIQPAELAASLEQSQSLKLKVIQSNNQELRLATE